MIVQSKYDPELRYTLYERYIVMRRNDDSEKISYAQIPEQSMKYIPEIRTEMMSFYNEKYPIKECIICKKQFRRKRQTQLTCCKACSREYTKRQSKEYSKKHQDQPKPADLDSLTLKCMKAKELGITYGKLQAMETWQWLRENGYGIGGAWKW